MKERNRKRWQRLEQAILLPLLLLMLLSSSTALGQSLGDVPGVVIDYQTNATRLKFFTDPEIIVLSNGDYVATHALGGFFSWSSWSGKTSVFRSSDQGDTWSSLGTVTGMLRASLFESGGDLYMIGANKDDSGVAVIRKSTNNGTTWSSSYQIGAAGASTPTNPVVYDNRIWCGWGSKTFSAPVGSNLLSSASWTYSASPPWNNYFGVSEKLWFEGQVIASPDTGVVVMPKIRPDDSLIYTAKPPYSAVIEVTSATTTSFDPNTGFVPLPGGEKKFGASYDAVSGKYYILSNPVLAAHADDPTWGDEPEMIRNTAAMLSSTDLYHWDVEKIFLYTSDLDHEGFQYFNFDYDGDDMVIASRTAFDIGGLLDRAHDANLLTFHKIEDFRTASPDQILTLDTGNNQVLRYETTDHEDAPLGSFTLGSTFDGTALTQPVAFGQYTNGDVYIQEQGGRILQFDALGNFIDTVASSPVTLQSTALSIDQPDYGARGWIKSGNGDWSDIRNWYYWGRPDTDYEIATLGSAVDSAGTVTVNEDFTIKGLRFPSASSYTLSGTGSFTLQADSGNGVLDVQQGDQDIQVDVTLNSDVDATLEADASLTFSGLLDLNGQTLAVTGPGEMILGGTFDINDGVLEITDGGFVGVEGTLTIDGSSAVNMATGGMLALYGDADDSLASFLGLISGTDAIYYWDDSISDWDDITSATLGLDYTLEYLTSGDWSGYTLLTVGEVQAMMMSMTMSAVPEPSSIVLLLTGLLLLVHFRRRR